MVKEQDEWSQLEKARNRFIQDISKNMELYGINQSIGRLYGTVLFAEEPMTLDKMSQSLGMSKTSMSTGIRALSEANMVERVWQKGVRKDLYQTEEDWYKSFSAVFVNRWRAAVDENRKAVTEMRHSLQKLLEQTEDDTIKESIHLDLEKLDKAENYYEWLGDVINLFEKGDIYNIVPKK
ncbi:GbsR/MarR family transcriptional regulator [Alkalihalobacillus sp. LMS39]|uniref:GbsR/MarR family transcriptional regulator n=1 Tax=Alkalihalobacillus sp. LMS39 TaxID=2924032 RepID=UPI001FB41978|nr:GbsR/MarR family transcriptional regulator [Alkalihalobacillus sp. LMS39]UOE92380.1 GbsR/MarR family transcriptional regulator [Alkalihalobacillus sp. LMS39]